MSTYGRTERAPVVIEERIAWARARVKEAEIRVDVYGGAVFRAALDARREELRELLDRFTRARSRPNELTER